MQKKNIVNLKNVKSSGITIRTIRNSKITPDRNSEITPDVERLIELAIKEDLGNIGANIKHINKSVKDSGIGDITSNAVIPKNKKIKAQIRVREHCVLCGINVGKKTLEIYEKLAKISLKDRAQFKILRKDGSFMQKNEVVAEISGNARTILAVERTILNFLAILSGVATTTNKFVERVLPYRVQLLDTRKTIAGYRELEKYAVRTGGGTNHRKGLYDMFLAKDNHISIAGNVKKAFELVIKAKKEKGKKNLAVEIEVESLQQLDELLKLKKLPDWVMLDNLSYEEMEIAVDRLRKRSKELKKEIKIEASGGVNLQNVSEIAKCGVDYISVGTALTLGAKPIDFCVDVIV